MALVASSLCVRDGDHLEQKYPTVFLPCHQHLHIIEFWSHCVVACSPVSQLPKACVRKRCGVRSMYWLSLMITTLPSEMFQYTQDLNHSLFRGEIGLSMLISTVRIGIVVLSVDIGRSMRDSPSDW